MDSASSSTNKLELALRSTNWQLSPKLEQNIYWTTERIYIDFNWSPNRFSPNPEEISIQHTVLPSLEKAIEYLRHILNNAVRIRRLDLNIFVSSTSVVNSVLEVLAQHEVVKLEELYVRRRYAGNKFSGLASLIRANVKTLRQIGKIGLGEAIESFNEELRLERLSLINFDLMGSDEELESEELLQRSRFFIRRLAGLGSTFDHLSYTCYGGFEITKMPALNMLRQCKVKSLRLTMQSGMAIQDPELPRPLLPMLQRLQLVGDMDVCCRNLSLLFPALEQLDVQKQDLITGKLLEKRARVLSNYAPDFVINGGGQAGEQQQQQEPNMNPVAAAC